MDTEYIEIIKKYGNDILTSTKMLEEKNYMQHGNVSVYEHSLKVCYIAIRIVKTFNLNVDMRALVRGALLHDFFLYDWHVPCKGRKLHAFYHARCAYDNAKKEFELGKIEKDIILKHMFPVNISLPKYKESYIVSIADKISATHETIKESDHELLRLCLEG